MTFVAIGALRVKTVFKKISHKPDHRGQIKLQSFEFSLTGIAYCKIHKWEWHQLRVSVDLMIL